MDKLVHRYFVSRYTDGPATRWQVIDRTTEEIVWRFAFEKDARAQADAMNTPFEPHQNCNCLMCLAETPR